MDLYYVSCCVPSTIFQMIRKALILVGKSSLLKHSFLFFITFQSSNKHANMLMVYFSPLKTAVFCRGIISDNLSKSFANTVGKHTYSKI